MRPHQQDRPDEPPPERPGRRPPQPQERQPPPQRRYESAQPPSTPPRTQPGWPEQGGQPRGPPAGQPQSQPPAQQAQGGPPTQQAVGGAQTQQAGPPAQGPSYEGPAGGPAGRPPTGRAALEPIRVGGIARTDVVTAEPDTPVATLVAEMAEENVGSVVIVDDDTPVGIVTDRQVALALETTPDVSEKPAEFLITEELLTGSDQMSVLDAVHRMAEAGVRRLPIVDEDGTLRGIVTMDDVLVVLGQELSDVARLVEEQSPGR